MNIVIITSLIIAATVIIGATIAFIFFHLSNAVRKEQYAMAVDQGRYNQALTAGHNITVDSDTDEQLKEAKLIAAKRAASLPRSANVSIGSYGGDDQPTASDGVSIDPVTAVKIAQHHTWQGLLGGTATAAVAAQPTLAPTQTAPPTKDAGDLVPGVDYPFIEVTDEMAPAEIRKARIANAKAKSAAVKAQGKSQPSAVTAAPAQPAAVQEAPAPLAASAIPAAGTGGDPVVGEPVAGIDYDVIEITDDMESAEIRKARITNAKAKSAAMKAFKAAGGQPQGAAAVPSPAEPVEPQSPPAAAVETAPEIPANIPPPEYVEISDDLGPEDIRKARIQNAKARSAYLKQLKAAGIDPSTVEL